LDLPNTTKCRSETIHYPCEKKGVKFGSKTTLKSYKVKSHLAKVLIMLFTPVQKISTEQPSFGFFALIRCSSPEISSLIILRMFCVRVKVRKVLVERLRMENYPSGKLSNAKNVLTKNYPSGEFSNKVSSSFHPFVLVRAKIFSAKNFLVNNVSADDSPVVSGFQGI
jgi:hypothetical protein